MTASTKNIVWATAARFVAVALFFGALAPLIPRMAESNRFSSAAFQNIIGVCFVAFAIFQLISIPVISLIGLRRSASLSCLYIAVASVMLCMTNATYPFALIFVSLCAVNSIGSNATRVALRQATSRRGFKRIFAWASGGVQTAQMFYTVRDRGAGRLLGVAMGHDRSCDPHRHCGGLD